MRKNSRNNAKKERIIMIASSAFVLTALTMTGIYMKSNNAEQKDDGYTIDFTALEDNVSDKYQEIAQNGNEGQDMSGDMLPEAGLEDDLDYMPMEVGSGLVELPGLTDEGEEDPAKTPEVEKEHEPALDNTPIVAETPVVQEPDTGIDIVEEASGGDIPAAEDVEIPADSTDIIPEAGEAQGQPPEDAGQTQDAGQGDGAAQDEGALPRSLHYQESEGLLRPVSGEVLLPYSMDSSIYFTTLAQYKYNSALMLQAQEDTPVLACAEGRVIAIFENEEIGHAVTMELGDNYQITYGQLKNITVSLNDYVDAGQPFAQVAAPTKYFCVEGGNLYLRMTANGEPVNPEALFR